MNHAPAHRRNEPAPRSFEVRAEGPDPVSPTGPAEGCERRGRGEVPGRIVRPLPRPNKQYTTGRVCAEPAARPSSRATTSGTTAGSTSPCTLTCPAASARARTKPPERYRGPPEPITRPRPSRPGGPRRVRRTARRRSPGAYAGIAAAVQLPRGQGARLIQGRQEACRCRGGPLPPSATPYDERDRRASRDARGRLPVLRANRARLRGAAPLPAVCLPAGRARGAPVRVPARAHRVARGRLRPGQPQQLDASRRPRTSLTSRRLGRDASSSTGSRLRAASPPPAPPRARRPGSSPQSSGGRPPSARRAARRRSRSWTR